MKRFWLSWWQPTGDHRPLTYPPNAGILGWWKSGERDDPYAASICALVAASTDDEAWKAVRIDWPEAIDFRFCEAVDAGWRPTDRFPISPWMIERIEEGGDA